MDYKEQDSKNTPSREFHPLQFAALSITAVLLLTLATSIFLNPQKALEWLHPKHQPISSEERIPWQVVKVRPKDTLTVIFNRIHLDLLDCIALLKVPEAKKLLQKLSPDHLLYLQLDSNGKLQKLIYVINRTDYVKAVRRDDLASRWTAQLITPKPVEQPTLAKGTIQKSFDAAAKAVGLSAAQIAKITDIFGGDMNFRGSLHAGDHFAVLYNAFYRENKKVKVGDIIAVKFTSKNNGGKILAAVRYKTKNGSVSYYAPNGQSLKRAFLRAPVHYHRISSPFGVRRVNPILHTVRYHEGVDLAAPPGTPIYAAGDGKIVFRGRRGAYGKCIIIEHNARLTTLYAHMSRFASDFHVGSYVREGNTIGFVGETGDATGPHLHYEYRINGVHYDPMKVKLPTANPVPKNEMSAYLNYARQMIGKLS